MLWSLLDGLLAAGLGAAFYFLLVPSWVAAVVVGGAVWESARLCRACWRQREARWATLVPRLVGAVLALAIAWLVIAPWDRVVVLAYLLLLLFEAGYRLVLRRVRPDRFHAAEQAVEPDGNLTGAEAAAWRRLLAWSCAALLVLLAPLALYAAGTRQVAADSRFYAAGFERWGAYDALVDLVAAEAPDLVRGRQDPLLRDAVRQLDEPGRREVGQVLLPRPWTAAVFEQVVVAVLHWLQAEETQRVPAVTVSVEDVVRHAKEALSVALDRHIAAMPVCPEGLAASSCRPQGTSVIAYTAVHKPERLASLDDTFALIPAEVDLSTAVALSPGTFVKPLAALAQARQARQTFDRLLRWAGVACLVLALGAFGLVRGRSALAQAGAILFVIAGRAWVLGLTWSTLPETIRRQAGETLNRPPWGDLLDRLLLDLAKTTNRLVWPWMVGLLAIGLALLAVGIFMGSSCKTRFLVYPKVTRQTSRLLTGFIREPLLCRRPMCVSIVILAVLFLAGSLYLDAGRAWYGRAYAAHRQGEVAQAAAGYGRIVRFYPVAVDEFVVSARIKLAECQAYQRAEAAYESGDVASAVRLYEALLARTPAIALQDRAQARLTESRYAWAAALWQEGEYERALDQYHAIQDRTVLQPLADAYLTWGDTLQREGDYRAAIATYRRLTFDVVNARVWAQVDERAQLAYCEWAGVLRTAGDAGQAGVVCAELLDAFSVKAVDLCPACAPR